MTPARRYFDHHARAFDRLYGAPAAARIFRTGPLRGRDLAVRTVERCPRASVLDLGCGPGRIAEAVLQAGAARYVGIDLSPAMMILARQRLARFAPSVELLEGDFLASRISETFDVVLALGLFDYLVDPDAAARWMHARCASILVASFTRWDPLKAPLRHARYRLYGCPVTDYTEERAHEVLCGAGFVEVDFVSRNRRGLLACATA